MANRGGSNYQRAVRDRFGNGFIDFGSCQRGCRAHRRTSVPECYVIGIYHSQTRNSKITHGTRGRTNVEGIANVHQDHA